LTGKIKHRTYNWTTKRNNRTIFGQCWKPEKESHKTILFIHGLGEHSGRYTRWAHLFVEKGYNFISFDLRGHGKSGGKRGHIKSINAVLKDIDFLFSKAKRLIPDSKFILYGQGMGGNLVANHVIKNNYPLKAVIITSPWLKLFNEPPYAFYNIVFFLQKIFPKLTISSGLNADQLTHDTEIVREYLRDPLVHNRISLRLFKEIHESGIYASRNIYKINPPLLIMHGSEDTITSISTSKNFVMNTSRKIHFKPWEGLYHELHNEFNYQEVFDYIIHWLRSHKL